MTMRAKGTLGVGVAALTLASLAVPVLAAEPDEAGTSAMTLGFYTINFVLFVVLLVRYASGGIKNYFSLRARMISSAFASLEGALRDAQAQAMQAAERVRQLPFEKARIEALIRKQTEQDVEAIRQAAHNLAAQIRRDGEAAARSIAEQAERQLRSAVARSAAQMAREMLREHFRPADQHRLVEDFVQEIAAREAQ
jgi:F0F1-type ATP synthase membrane subunit b/b'